MNFLKYAACLLVLMYLLQACNSPYPHRKKGYFNIEFPEKQYQVFDKPGYPYTFEYPVYSTVIKDSTFFGDKAEDWWININVPRFGGRIYISYKTIRNKYQIDTLAEDAYKMAHKQHVDVSTFIGDSLMVTPNGAEGMYYSLQGNTATANQFFLTDSTHHFLRGALYFDATPNEDSLSIVNNFLRQDLFHLINTLKWR